MRSYAFIKLATLEYPRHEGDIRAEHPEILETQTGDTFPCPATYAPVHYVDQPEFNELLQYCRESTPVQIDGQWFINWSVTQKPESALGAEIRTKRKFLIEPTDWTQGKDIPDSVSAPWAVYRQALRDITAQEGYPFNVTWPVPPA
jgi:hypothetical protein